MRSGILSFVLLLSFVPSLVRAATTNPDISVIGQPRITWTDDAGDPARLRPVFDIGETELVFDAALNPYARGSFRLTFADGEAGLEEGYFTLLRGLPAGLNLKGGKYRAGFGRLNVVHPHAMPFAERPIVLARYLPGEESFNETGMSVSWRAPLSSDVSVTATVDVLQGDSFRLERASSGDPSDPLEPANGGDDRFAEPRAAWLGRLASFVPFGERSGVEFGLSATEGTNNVAAAARTRVLGTDAKVKWWTGPNAYLVLQGEILRLERDDAGWDPLATAYTRTRTRGDGGYAYADYNWAQRWNAGASYESFADLDQGGARSSAVGLFAGFALLEETTAFRLDWRRIQPARAPGAPDDPEAVQQLTFRVLFSMGPHKVHQF